MSYVKVVVSLLWYCSALASYSRGDEIDPTWLARATSEGRASHDGYVAAVEQLEETCETRKEYDPPSNDARFTSKTIRFRWVGLNGCKLSERTHVNDDGTTGKSQIDCVNESYQFQIRNDGSTKPYVLTKYAPIKPGEVLDIGSPHCRCAITELSRLLKGIDSKDQHVLKALRWDEARRLLFFRMEYNASLPPKVTTVDMEAWLDQANHWRTVEIGFKAPQLHQRASRSYGPPIDGFSFLSAIDETVVPQGGNKEPAFRVRSALTVRKTTLSPADFRLSAFGLPEPVDAPPVPRSPTYLWLILAAAACVGLAVGFRYLARRQRVRHAV